MTAGELEGACYSWNGRAEEFARLVAVSSAVLGTYLRDLAAEFEVAESTVSGWANGIAKPHPRLQRQIITAIRRRAS